MNINTIIIFILILAIISMGIVIGVNNSVISNLELERAELQKDIAEANSKIDFQNSKIEQFKLDIEKADIEYKKGLKSLQEAYSAKDTDIKNKTCEEILNAIKQEQEIFLSGG